MASDNSGVCPGKALRRSNSSRLRMHAPSSIQVAPPSGRPQEWKVAIPLLSPLDILSLPAAAAEIAAEVAAGGPPEEKLLHGSAGEAEIEMAEGRWRHPAEPFYYDPIPCDAPAFAITHPAS